MLLVPCMKQPVHIVPDEGATTDIIDNRWSERTSVRWWGTPCGGRLRPLFAAAGDGLWLCVLRGDVVLVACEGVVLLGVARDAAAPPCVPSCRCGRGTQWSRRCGRRAGEEPHGPRLWSMSGRSNNRLPVPWAQRAAAWLPASLGAAAACPLGAMASHGLGSAAVAHPDPGSFCFYGGIWIRRKVKWEWEGSRAGAAIFWERARMKFLGAYACANLGSANCGRGGGGSNFETGPVWMPGGGSSFWILLG